LHLFVIAGILLASYLIGSIPFGFLIVKVLSGEDVRDVQSGRTGGTNTMRAAGIWAGLLTGTFDTAKTMSIVLGVRAMLPDLAWVHVFAALAGILGHNYSIYLVQRGEDRQWRFFGGAGGSAALGGAIGFWPPAGPVIIVLGILIWYFIGYASATTISIAGLALLIFALRASAGLAPWAYVAYGLGALALVVWALRPNIQRLRAGTERLHGFRARDKQ
jgi:glycerol-3-phosphate acyltransferase PlsY